MPVDPTELTFKLSGNNCETLELYFRGQAFIQTFTNVNCLDALVDLPNCRKILFRPAPNNVYGTLAIRYGPGQKKVRIYGWRRDKPKPDQTDALTWELPQASNLELEWVNDRIVRVHRALDAIFGVLGIIRFNDSVTPFQQFNSSTGEWDDFVETTPGSQIWKPPNKFG